MEADINFAFCVIKQEERRKKQEEESKRKEEEEQAEKRRMEEERLRIEKEKEVNTLKNFKF